MKKEQNRTPNASDVFIGRKLEEFLQIWMKDNNATKADFAAKVGVSPSAISQWVKGKARIRPTHFMKVCDVLGRRMSDFQPKTPEDKYAFDSNYISEYGQRLAEYARKKSLHLGFLASLIDLIDFSEEYPPQTPIGFDIDSETGDIHFFRGSADSDSAKIGKGMEMLQFRKGDQLLTFSPRDIDYLIEVQESLIKVARYMFSVRKQDVEKLEVEKLNAMKLNCHDAKSYRADDRTVYADDSAQLHDYINNAIRKVDPYFKSINDFLDQRSHEEEGQ